MSTSDTKKIRMSSQDSLTYGQTSGKLGFISNHSRAKHEECFATISRNVQHKLITNTEGHNFTAVLHLHSQTNFNDLRLYGPWALQCRPTGLCSLFPCGKASLLSLKWIQSGFVQNILGSSHALSAGMCAPVKGKHTNSSPWY